MGVLTGINNASKLLKIDKYIKIQNGSTNFEMYNRTMFFISFRLTILNTLLYHVIFLQQSPTPQNASFRLKKLPKSQFLLQNTNVRCNNIWRKRITYCNINHESDSFSSLFVLRCKNVRYKAGGLSNIQQLQYLPTRQQLLQITFLYLNYILNYIQFFHNSTLLFNIQWLPFLYLIYAPS